MKKFFFAIFCAILTSGCTRNSAPNARDYLSAADEAINTNRFAQAKLLLDSVHLLFPKQVEERRIAKYYSDSIVYLEAKRSYRYSDSLLAVLSEQKKELVKSFLHERDTNYEDIAHYIFPQMLTIRNTARCFLQAQVNDNGEMVVKSFYTGKKITQEYITISAVESDEQATARGDSYEFDDGNWHSILTIDNTQSAEVLNFISANTENRIKITLNEKDYSYFLQDNEKKMLQATYRLGILLNDIKLLERQINLAETQISVWESRHNKLQ